MEKRKIVLIGNHYIVIYNFRREFIQRLVGEGYEVIVFLPLTQETEKISALGCKLVDIPVDRRGINPIKDAKLFLRYKKKLKEIHPDMVFTYTIKPNIYAGYACRLLKIPYVCTITGLGKGIENGGIIRSVIMRMYKTALKKVKRVFFQNGDNRKLFLEHNIGKGHCGMVNGSGVNLEAFVQKEFPEESEPIRFLFMARIAKIKGIETFLSAVKCIKQKFPEVEFHLLGFGEEDYSEIITRLTEQKLIYYHGMQENVVPFLEQCQCLVHPSQSEGMSNACLEAAATGRAIIASDIPGCRECVQEGVTGYLHEMNNVQDLTEKIEKFILLPYNERKRMGEMGRKKTEKEFSRKLVVDAYMKELQDLQTN